MESRRAPLDDSTADGKRSVALVKNDQLRSDQRYLKSLSSKRGGTLAHCATTKCTSPLDKALLTSQTENMSTPVRSTTTPHGYRSRSPGKGASSDVVQPTPQCRISVDPGDTLATRQCTLDHVSVPFPSQQDLEYNEVVVFLRRLRREIRSDQREVHELKETERVDDFLTKKNLYAIQTETKRLEEVVEKIEQRCAAIRTMHASMEQELDGSIQERKILIANNEKMEREIEEAEASIKKRHTTLLRITARIKNLKTELEKMAQQTKVQAAMQKLRAARRERDEQRLDERLSSLFKEQEEEYIQAADMKRQHQHDMESLEQRGNELSVDLGKLYDELQEEFQKQQRSSHQASLPQKHARRVGQSSDVDSDMTMSLAEAYESTVEQQDLWYQISQLHKDWHQQRLLKEETVAQNTTLADQQLALCTTFETELQEMFEDQLRKMEWVQDKVRVAGEEASIRHLQRVLDKENETLAELAAKALSLPDAMRRNEQLRNDKELSIAERDQEYVSLLNQEAFLTQRRQQLIDTLHKRREEVAKIKEDYEQQLEWNTLAVKWSQSTEALKVELETKRQLCHDLEASLEGKHHTLVELQEQLNQLNTEYQDSMIAVQENVTGLRNVANLTPTKT